MSVNKNLENIIKQIVNSDLSNYSNLPENFDSVEVEVFDYSYEKMCRIHFLFNSPMSGYHIAVMRPIEIVIKRNLRSLFEDIFRAGIYSSLKMYDDFHKEEPILEYERKNQDKKYENEYNKLKKSFLRFFDTMIDSYYESDSVVHLYDKNEKRIISYYKDSGELYYSRNINDLIMELMPHYLWMRHSEYVMSDVFNSYFDYPVKYVTTAGMI